jgi:hypothetical protein
MDGISTYHCCCELIHERTVVGDHVIVLKVLGDLRHVYSHGAVCLLQRRLDVSTESADLMLDVVGDRLAICSRLRFESASVDVLHNCFESEQS